MSIFCLEHITHFEGGESLVAECHHIEWAKVDSKTGLTRRFEQRQLGEVAAAAVAKRVSTDLAR